MTMDAIEDIIARPVNIVEAEFEKTNTLNIPKTVEFFRNKFKDDVDVFKIPSLNDIPSHYLAPSSLVRFRAMVQDMHDPEYCMGVYETVNAKTKEQKLKIGLFKELSDCGADEDIVLESPKAVTVERQNLYCVPIPGETKWVKEVSFPWRNSL